MINYSYSFGVVMKLSESHLRAIEKLAPLSERLVRQHGVEINLASDAEHLNRVLEHYSSKKDFMFSEKGFLAFSDPNYAKAVLISETVRLLLREIAPKRSRKKKN